MLSNRDNPDNCFCVGFYCKEESWECHTSADCAKLDKCKELEEGRGCSCMDSTCESECATKVEERFESFQFTMPSFFPVCRKTVRRRGMDVHRLIAISASKNIFLN